MLAELVSHFPIIQNADPKTQRRFLGFFTATIQNPNTRKACARSVRHFFTPLWGEGAGAIKPFMVAAFVANLEAVGAAKPTIKLHLAALNKLFNWLVAGNIGLEVNPASAVRGPKHIVRQGKTPVLSAGQTRAQKGRQGARGTLQPQRGKLSGWNLWSSRDNPLGDNYTDQTFKLIKTL